MNWYIVRHRRVGVVYVGFGSVLWLPSFGSSFVAGLLFRFEFSRGSLEVFDGNGRSHIMRAADYVLERV